MRKTLIFTSVLILLLLFMQIDTMDIEDNYEVEYVIGVSQCNLGEPWRVKMNNDIKREASKHDNIRLIMLDASQNNDKQIQDVKKLIDLDVDLIIISPNEAEPLTDIVNQAVKSVPVILLDREISNEDYTLYIGADNYTIGKQIGDYVVDYAHGRKLNILEIKGLAGSAPTLQRSQGFKDAIMIHQNIEIIESIECDWLRDTSEKKVLEILKDQKKYDLVYSHNDPMALGAYYAFEANGHLPKFIGIDGLEGNDGGLDLVKRGILESTFTYPTGGQEAIQYALKILEGSHTEEKRILLKSIQVTSDNVDTFLNDVDTPE